MARVVTTDGTLVKDELTPAQAERDAKTRNERAERLGIETRYEVHE